MGIPSQKINYYLSLLTRDQDSIKANYINLLGKGLDPQKINRWVSLLANNLDTISTNFNFLVSLGIEPKNISKFPTLLARNQDSIMKNFDGLIQMEIPSHKICSNPGLINRNTKTLLKNLNYLTQDLGFDNEKIINTPQVLSENPDSFAEKMRILIILKLHPSENFNINKYSSFWFSSPATLIAKQRYCLKNGINYLHRLSILKGLYMGVVSYHRKEV